MKIGIDCRLWHESGVGRYIRNLVYGLDTNQKTSNEFVIFLPKKEFENIQFASPNFKKVLADVSWHSFSEQWYFKKIIEKENIDLMHFPYFSYPVFYKKPFVMTIHDLIIDHFPTGKSTQLPRPMYYAKRLVYKKITKHAVKNALKIIVPSNATKSELVKHYLAKDSKIQVIYEGFDHLIAQKNKNNNNLVSKNYILYVGNAYPHKNLNNLIKAYLELKKTHNIDLVCIGRNDFFYEKIENELGKGVYFLHNVDDSTLFDYYKGALCVVVPSFMEGFGLPLLEAMSLSCPVVSSDVDALREIGGDGSFYFNPNNISEISYAIKKVITDLNLRTELIRKGLVRSKHFSWEKCVEQTLKLYESCDSIRQGK